jgi:hypothetical protein
MWYLVRLAGVAWLGFAGLAALVVVEAEIIPWLQRRALKAQLRPRGEREYTPTAEAELDFADAAAS